MFEFCLLLWMADPAIAEPTAPVVATCARPIVLVVKPDQTSAVSAVCVTSPGSISRWLRRWEQATRNCPDRTRSEQDEIRQRIHESFNEHTLAAVERLVSHIDVNDLKQTFDWQIVDGPPGEVCLEAFPRDDLERLFYVSLRVSLDADQWNPKRLTVVGRNGLQRAVWQADDLSRNSNIQFVHFENDVPPAPNSFIRVASGKVD